MAGKAGAMSKAQSHIMFARVKATKAENENRRREEDQHRLCDPLERAKTFLRSRGWHVFKESILSWAARNSDRIIVGNNPMAPEDVIAMADRIRARAG